MGVWVITATYMSWTAARFIFNATPAMAVLGAWVSWLFGMPAVPRFTRKMEENGN